MNILYCGDANIIDGLLISILSLLKNTDRILNIYVLTMKYETKEKKYKSIPNTYIKYLDKLVKEKNNSSFVKLYDITPIVNDNLPKANLNTRFTPYCMLRLYADLLDFIPDKILYLDNDIVFLNNPDKLFDTNIKLFDFAGVKDFYGNKTFANVYLNSGVLLLNMEKIKKHNIFKKARKRCANVKMLLPDQTALNHYSHLKRVLPRKYNEQHKIKKDTVIRHFTTTFKVWPEVKTQTIKPWQIDDLHNILNCHEFDDILEKYQIMIKEIKKR